MWRRLRAVRQGLRTWLLVGEQRGVDEKAAQRSSITCYLNLSTHQKCSLHPPFSIYAHAVTKLVLICKKISFKLFFNAIFGTKLNVKGNPSVWRGAEEILRKNQTLPLPDFAARLQRNPTVPSSGRKRYSKQLQPGSKISLKKK